MLKESGWEFKTWETIGGSRKFKRSPLAATAGRLFLTNPDGLERKFPYGAVGRGIGKDILGDYFDYLGSPSLSVAPEFYPSVGAVCMLPHFSGDELEEDDFTGVTLIYEATGGAMMTTGGTVMLLGGSLAKLTVFAAALTGAAGATAMVPGPGAVTLAAPPPLFVWFIESFKAGILIVAASATSSIGAGIAGYLGYVTKEGTVEKVESMLGELSTIGDRVRAQVEAAKQKAASRRG